jgi:hypothetical protein
MNRLLFDDGEHPELDFSFAVLAPLIEATIHK